MGKHDEKMVVIHRKKVLFNAYGWYARQGCG